MCVCDDDDDDGGEKKRPEGGRSEFLYIPGGTLAKATKARCVRRKWNPKDFHTVSAYMHRMDAEGKL